MTKLEDRNALIIKSTYSKVLEKQNEVQLTYLK